MSQKETNKTTPKKTSSKTSSTKPKPGSPEELFSKFEELLERKSEALRPLEEFHKAVEDAAEEDVRIFWDVRMVHGANKPLKSVSGSSTMPSILAKRMLPRAPSIIQQEIVEKVALPLADVFMSNGEIKNPVKHLAQKDEDKEHPFSPPDEDDADHHGRDSILKEAQEHDDEEK